MRPFITLVLTACFAITYNLSTAQNGTVKGVIKDGKTQETIIGANVVWEKDKSKGASSDLDGKYELKLPAGKQTIIITSVGYGEQKKQIELKDGGILLLDITMEVSSQQLGTVVYSEGKFAKPLEKVTVSMDVIKPNIIENKNTTSMDQALQQAPGVVIVDNEPQIRGGSGYSFGAGSRVMVCVDDLPLLSGDAGRPSWGFLPVENVEQIEVIKGASSVLYGSAALNGVINIRTSYPRDVPQTKINVFTGLYDKPQTDENYYAGRTSSIQTGLNFLHSRKIGGQLDFVWGGNLFYDQGYIGPELGDTTVSGVSYNYGKDSLGNPDVNNLTRNEAMYERRARTNINLRYRFKKVEGLSIGVNGNIMYSHSNGSLLWLNDSSGLYRPYPGSVTETKQITYNVDPFLTYYGQKGASHSIRTRLFHVNNANSGGRANKSDWFYGNYMYQQRFDDYGIKEFTLTTGIMGSYTVAEASLYAGNEDQSGKSSATNLAAYLQLDKTFWKRLTVNAGVRYEHFAINGDDEGKPVFRAGMNLKVTNKETYLRGSFGQGFRFPTIAEKYIFTSIGPIQIYPNQSLGSETSWNAEIGIKQGVKIGNFLGYIDAAYFNQEYKNNIEFIFGLWDSAATAGIGGLINPGFRSVNIGPTRTSGVDISILGNGKIGKVGINMLLGYTYMKPISLDPNFYFDNDTVAKINYLSTSSDTANYILKYRFQHLVKADIEFTWKGFLVGGSLQYNSFMQNVDKLFEDFNNYQGIGNITAYRDKNNKGDYKIDMRVAYNVNKNNRIALIINNLLNREYALRPLNILPPRTFVIQYTLKI
jgi:iron complex outermembrane receptor protein